MSDKIAEWLEAAGGTLIKQSGVNWISTCPFHKDTRRSFSINSEDGRYICFSESCGVYGGLYAFLKEGCGFAPARALKLASEFSTYESPGKFGDWEELPDWGGRRSKEDPTTKKIAEHMLGLYEFCPEYMRNRGFSIKTLRKWEIGYDFEQKRVTIPVRDEYGELVGMSKRATLKTQETPYLHLEFKRSHFLYGAHFVAPRDDVWVTEGQLDALALSQFGLSAVSTMSARVSPTHVKKLSKHKGRVILAFDNDSDGRSATVRVGEGLLKKGIVALVARQYPTYVRWDGEEEEVKDPGKLVELYTRKSDEVITFLSELTPYDSVRLEPEYVVGL